MVWPGLYMSISLLQWIDIQIDRMIVLVLGCAVTCPDRSCHISRILESDNIKVVCAHYHHLSHNIHCHIWIMWDDKSLQLIAHSCHSRTGCPLNMRQCLQILKRNMQTYAHFLGGTQYNLHHPRHHPNVVLPTPRGRLLDGDIAAWQHLRWIQYFNL